MPDELKVDRSYHEALRRLGIQNPGEVRVGVPVQLQASVDDLSHLVAPVEVPVALVGRTAAAAGVGQFSGCEIEAVGNGVIIETIGLYAGVDVRIDIVPATLLTAAVAVIAPPAVFGPPVTAIFRSGNGPVNADINSYRLANIGQTEPLGVYLEPGAILAMMADGANLAVSINLHWREIPRPQAQRT